MRSAPIPTAIALLLLTSASAPLSAYQSLALQPLASIYRPVNVSFTSDGIILSHRPNDSATTLARLDANGTLHSYAPSFSGVQEVYLAEAKGNGGFNSGDLFLCSGDSIYRIRGGGGNAELFATPSQGSTVLYISFDESGSWGHSLYALTGNGGVWAVNATGSTKLVTNLGNNLTPEGLVVAPPGFGEFSGDLLVTMEGSHNLVAIPRNGSGTHINLATFPNQAPERVLEVIPNHDLLLAKYDQGTIVRIPAQNLTRYIGLVLVVTEGENGQAGSVNVLKATGTNITFSDLLTDVTSPHFEGAAFVPVGYLHVGSETTTYDGLRPGSGFSVYSYYLAGAGALIAVVVGALLVIFYPRKKK